MTKTTRSLALATVAITVGALGVLSAAPAYAATYTVCSGGGCNFTTIQSAIDDVSVVDGDTLNILAGTYNESITLDKSLTLAGPNASTSPNTGDPLVAAGRVAEAIITPPSGDAINAITITTAVNVTITGLNIDLTGSVYVANGQKYINALSAPGGGSLTVTNNIFSNAPANLEGELVYKTQTGDSTITVTNNRFTNGGLSNGLYLNNQSPNAVMTLNISNNVWLDNAYTAGNFSSDNGTVIAGSTANNWIGNSTPGTSGVDNFTTRQAGFLLTGTYDNFSLTNNTFKDIERSAIQIFNGFGGTIAITGNEIDGYSNVAGWGAVMVRPGSPLSDLIAINFSGNSITNPTTGSLAVFNNGDSGVLDARGNWWGTAAPVFNTLVDLSNVEDPVNFTVLVEDWLTSWGAASGGPGLAGTGANIDPALVIGAATMLLFGGGFLFFARRRRRQR